MLHQLLCVYSYHMQNYRHLYAVHNLFFSSLFACRCETHIPRKVPEIQHFYEFTRCRQQTVSTCGESYFLYYIAKLLYIHKGRGKLSPLCNSSPLLILFLPNPLYSVLHRKQEIHSIGRTVQTTFCTYFYYLYSHKPLSNL